MGYIQGTKMFTKETKRQPTLGQRLDQRKRNLLVLHEIINTLLHVFPCIEVRTLCKNIVRGGHISGGTYQNGTDHANNSAVFVKHEGSRVPQNAAGPIVQIAILHLIRLHHPITVDVNRLAMARKITKGEIRNATRLKQIDPGRSAVSLQFWYRNWRFNGAYIVLRVCVTRNRRVKPHDGAKSLLVT